jgi:hypothetical protein
MCFLFSAADSGHSFVYDKYLGESTLSRKDLPWHAFL